MNFKDVERTICTFGPDEEIALIVKLYVDTAVLLDRAKGPVTGIRSEEVFNDVTSVFLVEVVDICTRALA